MIIGMWQKATNRQSIALLSAKPAVCAVSAGMVRVNGMPAVASPILDGGDYRLDSRLESAKGGIPAKGGAAEVRGKGFIGQQQDKQRIETRSGLRRAGQSEVSTVLQHFTNGRSHVPDDTWRRV